MADMPLIALMGNQVDVSGPLKMYSDARQQEIANRVGVQKLGMQQQEHDLAMQAKRQQMANAAASAGRSAQNQVVEREKQMLELAGKYAQLADTPHKWRAYTQRLGQIFGPDSVKGFEDFSSRDKAMQLIQSRMKPTPQIQNFEYAQGLPEDQKKQFMQLKGGVNVNMPEQEKAFDKQMGEAQAKRTTAVYEKADEAQNLLPKLNAAREIILNPDLYTGSGGQFVGGLKKMAGTMFGLPVDGVGEAELLQTLNRQFALNDLQGLKGATSNKEMDEMIGMQFGISNSRRGNELILNMKQLEGEYVREKRDIYEQFSGGRTQEDKKAIREAMSGINDRYGNAARTMLKEMRKIKSQQPSPAAGAKNALKRYQKWGIEIE